MLGDAKRARPNPTRAVTATMKAIGLASLKRAKRKSPTPVKAIPAEATLCGSILSESLPATGEKSAWTMGCEISTNPAA